MNINFLLSVAISLHQDVVPMELIIQRLMPLAHYYITYYLLTCNCVTSVCAYIQKSIVQLAMTLK